MMIDRVVLEAMKRWIGIAEERLRGTGIRCFVNAGNDDDGYIDEALRQSEVVENHDGGVTDLTDQVQMAVCGYSNTTPFDSPREMSEPDLEAHIEGIVGQLKSPRDAVFTLHVPPYNTGIDVAPLLRDGKVVTEGGHTDDGCRRVHGRAPRHRASPADAVFAWPYSRIARHQADRPYALHKSRKRIF